MDYAVVYLPESENGASIEISGFNNYSQAEEWVIKNRCCEECKELYLQGSESLLCMNDWAIGDIDKLENATNLLEIMNATSWFPVVK